MAERLLLVFSGQHQGGDPPAQPDAMADSPVIQVELTGIGQDNLHTGVSMRACVLRTPPRRWVGRTRLLLSATELVSQNPIAMATVSDQIVPDIITQDRTKGKEP